MDLFKNGYRFYNKYMPPIKTTKKEDELIGFLRDEVGCYGNMLYGQSIGDRDFNIQVSNFENISIKLTSYFKNNSH
ncbi:hypothetical protein [Clostridium tagluense]|uniref:Uncharacterized protein n=2 Tax=Clostridiaceae TaxID=31979 RepID=A0A401US43_9CLOT|nr:hypothetical protein [Clostridium tagluense]GCD12382.1 hypothetical protein Ctaglu_40050 [Clostridium tagluense]